MAKYKQVEQSTDARKTRRQLIEEQEAAAARRQIMKWVGLVIGIIGLVLIVAVVVELVIQPNQPVAIVNGQDITSREWEKQVRHQRAQLIGNIDDFYENTGGDVGLLQQLLGSRITVTEADIDERLGANYNFFDGGLPTPVPTGTTGPEPTPSLTPIPTAVITEVVPTNTPFPTAEPLPTGTPAPTITPVTLESFEESLAEDVERLEDIGGEEELLRESVRAQIYRDRLAEALAEEQELAVEELHASAFVLSFQSEADAQEALALIEAGDYLDVWNQIRSVPVAQRETTGAATELLWRPESQWIATYGSEVADAAFALEVGESSGILGDSDELAEQETYYIIMVSGREVRPLTDSQLEVRREEILQSWLEQQRTAVQRFERWRPRTPTQPALDPRYLVQPTPVQDLPSQSLPTPVPDGGGVDE
jgi:hypothetical protein